MLSRLLKAVDLPREKCATWTFPSYCVALCTLLIFTAWQLNPVLFLKFFARSGSRKVTIVTESLMRFAQPNISASLYRTIAAENQVFGIPKMILKHNFV